MRVAELLAHGGLGQQFARGDHPAHAQARAENLAHAAAVSQQLAAAGNIGAQGQQARRRCLVEIQVAVRIVFHHHGLVFDSEGQNFLATLKTEQSAAGVAEGRNEVHKLGFVLDHQALQRIGLHPLRVNRCANDVCTVQAKTLDGG